MIHTELRINSLLAVAEYHLATTGLLPTDIAARLLEEGIDPSHLTETEHDAEEEN